MKIEQPQNIESEGKEKSQIEKEQRKRESESETRELRERYLTEEQKKGMEEGLGEKYLREFRESERRREKEEEKSMEEAESKKEEGKIDKGQETLEGAFKRVKGEKEEEEELIKEKILEKMRAGKAVDLTKEEKEIYERWIGKKKVEQGEPTKEKDEGKETKTEAEGIPKGEGIKEEEYLDLEKAGYKPKEEKKESKGEETEKTEEERKADRREIELLDEELHKAEIAHAKGEMPDKEYEEMKKIHEERIAELNGIAAEEKINEKKAKLEAEIQEKSKSKIEALKKILANPSFQKGVVFGALMGASIAFPAIGVGYGTLGLMSAAKATAIWHGVGIGALAASAGYKATDFTGWLRKRREKKKKETEKTGEKLEEVVETGDETKLEEVDKIVDEEIKETEEEIEKDIEEKKEKGSIKGKEEETSKSLEEQLTERVEGKKETGEAREETEEKIKNIIEKYKRGDIDVKGLFEGIIPQLGELLEEENAEEIGKRIVKEVREAIKDEDLSKTKEEVMEAIKKSVMEGKITSKKIGLMEKILESETGAEEEGEKKEGKEEKKVDISQIKKNIGITVKELQQGLGKSLEISKLELDDEDIESWRKLEEGLEEIRKAYTKDTRLRNEKNPKYDEQIKTLFSSLKEGKKATEEKIETGEITEEEIRKNPDKYIITPEVFEVRFLNKRLEDLTLADFKSLRRHIFGGTRFLGKLTGVARNEEETEFYKNIAEDVKGKKLSETEVKELFEQMSGAQFINKYIDPKIKEKYLWHKKTKKKQ